MTRRNENSHLHQQGKHKCTICGDVFPLGDPALVQRADGSTHPFCRRCFTVYMRVRSAVGYQNRRAAKLREIGVQHGK